MTQKARVKASLERGNTLTSLTAGRDLAIGDLPKRMSELKQDEYEFQRDWLTVINRFGEKTRVRRYYL